MKPIAITLGDPAGIEFLHDQMASYNGRWALMEVQPGQTNCQARVVSCRTR